MQTRQSHCVMQKRQCTPPFVFTNVVFKTLPFTLCSRRRARALACAYHSKASMRDQSRKPGFHLPDFGRPWDRWSHADSFLVSARAAWIVAIDKK